MRAKRVTDGAASANEAETFIPLVSFEGYPNGKTAVRFFAGIESMPVSREYAELIRQKGLSAPLKA